MCLCMWVCWYRVICCSRLGCVSPKAQLCNHHGKWERLFKMILSLWCKDGNCTTPPLFRPTCRVKMSVKSSGLFSLFSVWLVTVPIMISLALLFSLLPDLLFCRSIDVTGARISGYWSLLSVNLQGSTTTANNRYTSGYHMHISVSERCTV